MVDACEEVEFLIVEDDVTDQEAIERYFKKNAIRNPIFFADNGSIGISKLKSKIEAQKRPVVVLLDWKMPQMGGGEFLRRLRSDEEIKRTVVFVLSSSDDPRDINEAYESNVAGYLLKPGIDRDIADIFSLLEDYLKKVELPT